MIVFVVSYAHTKVEAVFRNTCTECSPRTFLFFGSRTDAQEVWERAVKASDARSGFYRVDIDPKTRCPTVTHHGRRSNRWHLDSHEGVPVVVRRRRGMAVIEMRAEDLI